MMNRRHNSKHTVRQMVMAAICLGLCMVLPFLTGQIQQIGNMLSPMHLPVLLAGFICGPIWGLIVGAVAPVLRFAMFGMPPLFPTGAAMCFELAAYGFLSGLIYGRLQGSLGSIYIALIGAMAGGRVLWGVVMAVLLGLSGSSFTWAAFIAGAFTNAIPGIILQIVLIPILVVALRKSGIKYQNYHMEKY